MILDVVALFLTGFVSLVGQIVLLRELSVAFFGVELVYLIALGVWFLLAAIGTLAGRRKASPDWTATLFLFFAFCLPLGVVFLRASRLVLGGVIGLRLHTAENFWTPQLTRRTASIHHALRLGPSGGADPAGDDDRDHRLPYPNDDATCCAKISLTHKTRPRILPPQKSKFLSIR